MDTQTGRHNKMCSSLDANTINMLVTSPKIFASQHPQKLHQGDQLVRRHYAKSSPFLFNFWPRSISGKVKPRRQRGASYGCNRWWWWRTCRVPGPGVQLG